MGIARNPRHPSHENLVFDQLIVDRKYQFVFIFPPVPVRGPSGSNDCPIAVTREPRTTEWAS
jgi:hypothetical protein